MFQHHILAGNTHIRCAVLNISRHVRSPHNDKPYIIAVGGEDQITRGLGIIQRDNTRRFQQRRCIVENATLGKGNSDTSHRESMENLFYPKAATPGLPNND